MDKSLKYVLQNETTSRHEVSANRAQASPSMQVPNVINVKPWDESAERNRDLWKKVACYIDWLSFICLGAGLIIGTLIILFVVPP